MSVIDIPFTVRRNSVLARIWVVVTVAVPVVGRWLARIVERGRQLALYAGGLASLCYAAWQIAEPLGWTAIGISCLLVEGLTSNDEG